MQFVGCRFILHLILRHEIRMFRVRLTRGAACRANMFERAEGRVLPRRGRMTIGLIANLPIAISRTSGWASVSDRCSSNSRQVPARVLRCDGKDRGEKKKKNANIISQYI